MCLCVSNGFPSIVRSPLLEMQGCSEAVVYTKAALPSIAHSRWLSSRTCLSPLIKVLFLLPLFVWMQQLDVCDLLHCAFNMWHVTVVDVQKWNPNETAVWTCLKSFFQFQYYLVWSKLALQHSFAINLNGNRPQIPFTHLCEEFGGCTVVSPLLNIILIFLYTYNNCNCPLLF